MYTSQISSLYFGYLFAETLKCLSNKLEWICALIRRNTGSLCQWSFLFIVDSYHHYHTPVVQVNTEYTKLLLPLCLEFYPCIFVERAAGTSSSTLADTFLNYQYACIFKVEWTKRGCVLIWTRISDFFVSTWYQPVLDKTGLNQYWQYNKPAFNPQRYWVSWNTFRNIYTTKWTQVHSWMPHNWNIFIKC